MGWIDPTADHMDNFLSRQYERDPSPPRRQFFSGVVIARIKDDSSSRTAASSWPLNESELDYMGDTRGWEKIEGLPAQPPMASYKKDGIRLNFWLSTGTVGSYLNHPRQGKTQLFRREISMSEASDIFNNPRQHTGKGYHHKNEKKVVQKRRIEMVQESVHITHEIISIHPKTASISGNVHNVAIPNQMVALQVVNGERELLRDVRHVLHRVLAFILSSYLEIVYLATVHLSH